MSLCRMLLATLSAAALVLCGNRAFAQVDAKAASKLETARCEGLTGGRFVELESAPTWIIKAAYRAATPQRRAYCEIDAYVNPTVGFGMYMPAESWNGKYLFRGCGGSCGSVHTEGACSRHLRDGYACIITDMGHRSDQIDNNWVANNLQGQVDFGYRSTHAVAIAGKAIVAAYYERPAKRSYFYGCSTGGRQALVEAQRFPLDFDGIVSIAPASMGPFGSRGRSGVNPNRGANGAAILSDLKVPLIYRAVIAQCDLNDGVRDGIVDPRDCKFDPGVLQCKSDAGSDCLTGPEVAVARKFYERGAQVGSELNWINNWTAKPGPATEFVQSRGDASVIETLDNVGNPDLRAFKAHGGKLILAHGSTDLVVPAGPSMDYYELATATMGGPEKTREFFRFFVIGGMDHCSGGDGAWGVDYVTAIDNWVDKDQAPDRLVGVHPKLGVDLDYFGIDARLLKPDQIEFSRPYFPHPLRAYYSGKGDPADASSFIASMTPPKPARRAPDSVETGTPPSADELAGRISYLIKLSEDAYARGVALPPKNISDRIGKALRRMLYSANASRETVAAALEQVGHTELSGPAQVAIALIKPEYAAH